MQSTVNERIKILIDTFDGGVSSRFAKRIGVSPSVVSAYLPDNERQGEPGFSVLQKIINAIPEIQSEWLLRGSGDMLIKNTNSLPNANNYSNRQGNSDNNIRIGGQPPIENSSESRVIELLQGQLLDLKKENESLKEDVKKLNDELLGTYREMLKLKGKS